MVLKILENYGNPSSTHSFGRASRTIVEKARKSIAAKPVSKWCRLLHPRYLAIKGIRKIADTFYGIY